jgi:hypothetical protein
MSWKWKPGFIEKRERARKEQQHEDDRSDYVAALNEIKQAYVDAHKDDASNEKWNAFREYLTIGLVLLTVVLTGLSYCVFYQTMIEARAAAKAAHKDNVAALTAADRPWVGVDSIDVLPLDPKQAPQVNVHVRNTGHSPALAMHGTFDFKIIGDYPGSISFTECMNCSHIALLPNAIGSFTPPMTEELRVSGRIQGIIDDKETLMLFGRVDYSDAQGGSHKTYFCGLYPRKWVNGTPLAFGACTDPNSNYAD